MVIGFRMCLNNDSIKILKIYHINISITTYILRSMHSATRMLVSERMRYHSDLRASWN